MRRFLLVIAIALSAASLLAQTSAQASSKDEHPDSPLYYFCGPRGHGR